MRRLVTTLLGLLVAGGFYLLLIDSVDPPELYAMIPVALAGVALFEASRRERLTEATVSLAWFARAWRAVARVPPAVAIVTREALAQLVARKAVRGEFVAIPFKGGDDTHDVGRYALTELLGSLAPNTVVVGIDPDRELLLVHRLRGRGSREELDVLRLG